MKAQIVLENVGIHLPNRILFEQVNWTLYEGARVTLAGRNGSGKSTLLRVIAGKTESTSGQVTIVGKRELRIGHLDQMDLDATVLKMQTPENRKLTPVVFLYQRLVPADDPETDPREWQWRIEKTLSGLGFDQESMKSPVANLSGGWLLRMFIAETLLNEPDVLLLDEPTNHLDISSIQWLEEFLETEYSGSLILVTHDVSLQKRTTDCLAILHGGRFYFRKHQKDYLSFRASLDEEKEIIQKQLDELNRQIEENQEFVDRYRAKARTAGRAQSKLKALKGLTDKSQELKQRLNRIRGFSYHLRFNFRLVDPGGRFPLSLDNLSFHYDKAGPWILKDLKLDVSRGQKIAVIGDNGAGKTTLLNVLAGRLKPVTGIRQEGHAVSLGYFGQHQLDEIDLENTVVENLRNRAPDVPMDQLRGWLGAFGFYGDDDLQKKAKVLSGGERARLALLRILVTPINVCLLDEPTNHLDIETKELLKNAIRSFEGTVIFVSHDREFIEGVATRIIHLSNTHELVDYPGQLDAFFARYPEFVRHVEKGLLKHRAVEPKRTEDSSLSTQDSLSYEDRKRQKNRIRSLEKKIAEIEAEIDDLGHRHRALEHEMIDSEFYTVKDEAYRNQVFSSRQSVERQINAKMSEWERCSTELEAARRATSNDE